MITAFWNPISGHVVLMWELGKYVQVPADEVQGWVAKIALMIDVAEKVGKPFTLSVWHRDQQILVRDEEVSGLCDQIATSLQASDLEPEKLNATLELLRGVQSTAISFIKALRQRETDLRRILGWVLSVVGTEDYRPEDYPFPADLDPVMLVRCLNGEAEQAELLVLLEELVKTEPEKGDEPLAIAVEAMRLRIEMAALGMTGSDWLPLRTTAAVLLHEPSKVALLDSLSERVFGLVTEWLNRAELGGLSCQRARLMIPLIAAIRVATDADTVPISEAQEMLNVQTSEPVQEAGRHLDECPLCRAFLDSLAEQAGDYFDDSPCPDGLGDWLTWAYCAGGAEEFHTRLGEIETFTGREAAMHLWCCLDCQATAAAAVSAALALSCEECQPHFDIACRAAQAQNFMSQMLVLRCAEVPESVAVHYAACPDCRAKVAKSIAVQE